MVKKVAIVTNGGDCPGLNAVIRAIVKTAEAHNVECYGFIEGYKGMLENEFIKLDSNGSASGLLHRGGTIIGTSNSTNVFNLKVEENGEIVYEPNFKNFSVKLVVNPEPTKDKIFNTVEFRADAFNSENEYLGDTEPFSNIQVENEYQDTGDVVLNNINLRKKFRIWRHTIQRDEVNKRDRIRNPWATITLKNENPEDNKVVLHDIVISYFD
jgi:hypothetical protein